MKTTKRFIMMTLAGVVGLSGAAVTALAVGGDDLVTLCFRNRTIQVPFYLINRYLAVLGTTTGPCIVSP